MELRVRVFSVERDTLILSANGLPAGRVDKCFWFGGFVVSFTHTETYFCTWFKKALKLWLWCDIWGIGYEVILEKK